MQNSNSWVVLPSFAIFAPFVEKKSYIMNFPKGTIAFQRNLLSLSLLDCPTQLIHDKAKRTQQGNLLHYHLLAFAQPVRIISFLSPFSILAIAVVIYIAPCT